MATLSISRAWDETKRRIAADGRLMVTVALALLALPGAIAQFVGAGSALGSPPKDAGDVILLLVVWLLGLVGQLSIARLALGPSVSVGEAISHGFRRSPAYIGAMLLLVLGLMVLLIPLVILMAASGVPLEPGAPLPPAATVFLLLMVLVFLYFALRMILASPIAAAESGGPLAIIRRSWRLTSGQFLRLLGFFLLFIIAAAIVVFAVTLLANLVATLASGEVEPLTVGALILALAEAVASAVATTVFVVMLARIYVQLSGGDQAAVSVPSSGT